MRILMTVITLGALLGLLLLGFATCIEKAARADEPIDLPPEIRECLTDADCEVAAEKLCADGNLEWCLALS